MRMLPKRRKPEKSQAKPTSALDDKARALGEQQDKLRAEIERRERLIKDAPKIAKERERVRREELVKRASRTDARPGSRVALQDPRHGFELNAAMPAQRKSLRAERRRGRLMFFVLPPHLRVGRLLGLLSLHASVIRCATAPACSALNLRPSPALLPVLMSAAFDVRYTAQLARLHLSEEEISKFQAQISQVLAYVEKLEQVDVSGVEPTAHANAVFNVFREDASQDWFTPEQALANAPRSANQLFVVPKVIE